MTDTDLLAKALNKLAKWRLVFTGWQLGTRPIGEPESDAVRDHREVTILLRAETNALLALLMAKGVFTEAEWSRTLTVEAAQLDSDYEKKFPGFKTSMYGVDVDVFKAKETMKGWRP